VVWFRQKVGAERFHDALQAAGITSTVRRADDPPPGVVSNEKQGFVVDVNEVDFIKAADIFTEVCRPFTQSLCTRCQRKPATVHVVRHDGQKRTEERICEECYVTAER
jgi:hypothetical protein